MSQPAWEGMWLRGVEGMCLCVYMHAYAYMCVHAHMHSSDVVCT